MTGGGNQWLLTDEEFGHLWSTKGITEDEEHSIRYEATGFAQQLGMALKLYFTIYTF